MFGIRPTMKKTSNSAATPLPRNGSAAKQSRSKQPSLLRDSAHSSRKKTDGLHKQKSSIVPVKSSTVSVKSSTVSVKKSSPAKSTSMREVEDGPKQQSAPELHLYEQIAEEIRTQIEHRVLQPGNRLPSVRKLSRQKGVSISTVLQAYMNLEDVGIIEARPQSGYYVRQQFRNMPPEPSIQRFAPKPKPVKNVVTLVEDLINTYQYSDFVPLGAAMPAPDLLPITKISKLYASLARSEMHKIARYEHPTGNVELRRQIVLRAMDWGGLFAPDDVITTGAATEALTLCLRAVAGEGDTIAVESPCYFGILRVIEGLGMKALEIPTDPKSGISLESLEPVMRKRQVKALVVVANFSNPLGCCMPDENKARLAALAAEYEIPIIEDDVYGEIYFSVKRPRPLKAFDDAGWVMLCDSFSKTVSPGLRVGYTIPGRFYENVYRLKIASTLASPTLPQLVMAKFLQTGGYEHQMRALRKAFSVQIQKTITAVGEYFPEGTKVTRPTGGFVVWVECPAKLDAITLHGEAMREKISIAPGPAFSKTEQYNHFIRLNCGYPWTDRLDDAVRTLGRLAAELCR
ncbi:MAG: PLP-dependent aminotransferase family protein [Candidatus Kapabacteria bacterium]|nr:PLP-dependent aminotransferase family protein [Candidatus Kapabacteria bacterium]